MQGVAYLPVMPLLTQRADPSGNLGPFFFQTLRFTPPTSR